MYYKALYDGIYGYLIYTQYTSIYIEHTLSHVAAALNRSLSLHNLPVVRTIVVDMTQRPAPSSEHASQTSVRARPFLKWAGGKQHLLRQLTPLLPQSFSAYAEPFVGSGALFFHMRGEGRLRARITLSDNNADLINAYRVVRDNVEALIEFLAEHRLHHSREHYYATRALDRNGHDLNEIELAARMIYLNRTCYNGLYRVNQQGQFNVPMGSYQNPTILQEKKLRAASAALKGVELVAGDYLSLLERREPGDLVYFDPPYQPLSRTSSFTSYTATAFSEDDQRRLATVYRELSERGVLCMLSNSNTPLIRELYADFRIELVRARRMINSQADGRGAIDEVVILNY